MPIYFVLSIERAPFPLIRFVARQVVRFSERGIDPVWVIRFRTRGPGREPRPTEALFLTGPERGKRSALGRRLARAVAQRRRRCPPLAPGGGNGKGGEPIPCCRRLITMPLSRRGFRCYERIRTRASTAQ